MINIYNRFSIFFFVLPAIVFSFYGNFLLAQHTVQPFQSGEKLHYKVSYNWEFVWIDAGKVVFEVDSLMYDGQPAYHFKSFGRSLTSYDWIYKVRDYFESVANADTFHPYWFTRKTREGGYQVNNKFNFDYENNRIISKTQNSNRPTSKDTLSLEGFVMDVQTAVYYIRALDFSSMPVGENIPFRMIIDGEVFDLYGYYLGKEIIENHNGQIYRCHKFSTSLVDGTIFSGGEDLFVWLTDDYNRIPLLVEANILVGSVKAYFIDGENILHPMESLVE